MGLERRAEYRAGGGRLAVAGGPWWAVEGRGGPEVGGSR
jgi:hypothetical protein